MVGMLGCISANASMKTNVKLLPGQEKILNDPDRYQMLVDRLNYLTVTTSYCICCECCELVSLSTTVLKIGLIGRLIGRLILFGGSPLNITLIALIMRSGD